MPAVKKIFILYTGGTLGMLPSAAGLVPGDFQEPLTELLRDQEDICLDWQFAELQPVMDSANMTQAHWLAMRDAIVAAVERGTDTLAYSAAALSFLLLGLEVPVVLTGAMQPLGIPGSDARDNLCGALLCLQRGTAPGVWLYFNFALLHGARVSKLRTTSCDAFAVLPRQRQMLTESFPAALHYRQVRQLVNLAVLPLHPCLRVEHLRGLLDSGVQALLLECYGSGTGPTDNQALLNLLREARERGVLLVAISQCPEGHVEFDLYAAGSGLREAGLISAGGMTREAALGKLFSLLGCGLSLEQTEHLLAVDLCGESFEMSAEIGK